MLAHLLLNSLVFIVSVSALWPQPKRFEHGSKVLWLSPSFDIKYAVEKDTLWSGLQKMIVRPLPGLERDSSFEQDKFVHAAVERLYRDIQDYAFEPWKFHPPNGVFEPDFEDGSKTYIQHIKLCRIRRPSTSTSAEAYHLLISEDGTVTISAHDPIGIIRAFSSLTQLFFKHSKSGEDVYTNTAPVVIEDEPVFAHRGLNIDISRNVIGPSDIMRTIEALAINKFNRLHIHAIDAQSWPLEIPSIPELAQKGAYHDSQVWSAADLRDVQGFGALRGIEVYIEIDMPGHTASVQSSHPELLISFNREPWQQFSAQPPAGQLKLDDEAVREFIAALLHDLLPRSKPFSSLFHLGGDEITAAAYNMTHFEVPPYLQSFIDHALDIVRSYGLTPVVWEEQLLDYNLTLPADILIQAWRGSTPGRKSALAEIVGKGHKAIFGQNDHWYLDCGHGGWVDRDIQNPDSPIQSPYVDYCSPYKNWKQVLSYDPLADVPIDQRYLVVGGEVSLWGEQTDSMNLDSSLWPRVAAAGEVLWAGHSTIGEDATRRLADMRERLVAKGVASAPVQVTWCLMNPGNCIA